MKKIIASFLAVLLLAGCGRSSKSTAASDVSNYAVGGDSAPISEQASASVSDNAAAATDTEITTADSEKKIVYTGSLTVETLDYDASMIPYFRLHFPGQNQIKTAQRSGISSHALRCIFN